MNVQDTPAKAINDFQPLTTYYVRVKADCGEGDQSQWSNVISFSTTAVAQNVGDAWSDDFEGASCGWELINGTVTSANWFWGTAENNGSGTHSIYTTKDNGNTCSYNISGNAKVYATKLLTFADGEYTFQFDWKCNGETKYDYLRVGLLPGTAVITADATSNDNLPTEWISLHDATNLSGVTAWQTSPEKTVQLERGNYYLVLRWRQDASGGSGTGAAVDNVSITLVSCIEKTIGAHGTGEETSGWYLIASPLAETITDLTTVENLINTEAPDNFDLYRFNQAPTATEQGKYLEWENYKSHTQDFSLNQARATSMPTLMMSHSPSPARLTQATAKSL